MFEFNINDDDIDEIKLLIVNIILKNYNIV